MSPSLGHSFDVVNIKVGCWSTTVDDINPALP